MGLDKSACANESQKLLDWIISNSAKSTGPLLIWLVREVTFGRSRS